MPTRRLALALELKAGRGPCELGRRAGGQLTHKHAASGEVFRLHVRVPVEPQLLGLDPPLEGREQLGHPGKERGKIDRLFRRKNLPLRAT